MNKYVLEVYTSLKCNTKTFLIIFYHNIVCNLYWLICIHTPLTSLHKKKRRKKLILLMSLNYDDILS